MPLDSIPGLLETGLQVYMPFKKKNSNPKYSCRIIEQIFAECLLHAQCCPSLKGDQQMQDQRAPVPLREDRDPGLWGQTAANSPLATGLAQPESRGPCWGDGWDDSSAFLGPNLHGLGSHLGSTQLPSWEGQYQLRPAMHTGEQGFRKDAEDARGLVPLEARGPQK